MANYKFIDKSVLIDGKILVIADLHLGYEEMMRQQGVFIPKSQFRKIIEDLEKIFKEVDRENNKKIETAGKKQTTINKKNKDINGELRVGNFINKKGEGLGVIKINKNISEQGLSFNKKLKEIIILGDLKHEFSEATREEWKEVSELIDYLKKKTEKIILIRGNHDNYLMNIASRLGIEIKDFYTTENYAFIHGDKKAFVSKNDLSNNKTEKGCLNNNGGGFDLNNKKQDLLLDKKIKTIFLGHLHPAICIREGAKQETYKCFLVGKFKDKEIIILPSFFPLIEGLDVSRNDLENSNLAYDFDLKNFLVFIPAENSVLDFGKLKDVGRLS